MEFLVIVYTGYDTCKFDRMPSEFFLMSIVE